MSTDHEGNPVGTHVANVHPGCCVELVHGQPALWDDDSGYLTYSPTEALRLAFGLVLAAVASLFQRS